MRLELITSTLPVLSEVMIISSLNDLLLIRIGYTYCLLSYKDSS